VVDLKKTIEFECSRKGSSGSGAKEHSRVSTGIRFQRSIFRIYDDPTKESAMRAFEAWENSLPDKELDKFHSLAKTVHNHYDDIFAYWDSPSQITNAYTECLNGLIKMANRIGRGYSYEIIRAKTLYAKQARKVGSGVRLLPSSESQISAKTTSETIEYGPHIPTLIGLPEDGDFD